MGDDAVSTLTGLGPLHERFAYGALLKGLGEHAIGGPLAELAGITKCLVKEFIPWEEFRPQTGYVDVHLFKGEAHLGHIEFRITVTGRGGVPGGCGLAVASEQTEEGGNDA